MQKANKLKKMSILSIMIATFFVTDHVMAETHHRLTLGAGVIKMDHPNETNAVLGLEYENIQNEFFGIGGGVNVILSDPTITLVSIPEIFWHPLGGEWYVHASPLFQFGSSVSTKVGTRVGTQVPISFGFIKLIPTVSMDFIDGGENLMAGIGISF